MDDTSKVFCSSPSRLETKLPVSSPIGLFMTCIRIEEHASATDAVDCRVRVQGRHAAHRSSSKPQIGTAKRTSSLRVS